jgi:signal transduction histidine kinase
VLVVPQVRFHIVSPATNPVLIAGCGAAALYVAFVAGRRFARSGAALDLGVAVGLGLIGLANVVFVLERSTLAPDASTAAELLPYHVAGALALAASAFVPVPAVIRRTPGISIVAAIATLALTVLLLRNAGVLSAAGVVRPGTAEATGWRLATCAAMLGATAVLLARRAVRDDPLMRWVAVATLLLAGAQAARIADPVASLVTVTWAHAFYAAVMLALLAGAVAEGRAAVRVVADLAVADERRRVARDIHDGPAQDLAFVASQSRQLARTSGDERLREIAFAAERALDDSRAVVEELTQGVEAPLQPALERLAREHRDRWGLRVTVALESTPELDAWQERELVAIVREALSNAARHSQAERAEIRLGYRRGVLTLTVSDDGRGFDLEAAHRAASGFGIQTMTERARLMGGELRFESACGQGTKIEIPIR